MIHASTHGIKISNLIRNSNQNDDESSRKDVEVDSRLEKKIKKVFSNYNIYCLVLNRRVDSIQLR